MIILVVVPSTISKLDYKKNSLSFLGTRNTTIGRIFNLGLIITGLFQIAFMLFLTNWFDMRTFPLGAITYLISSSFLIIGGLITLKNKRNFHNFVGGLGFLLNGIAILWFGFNLLSINSSFAQISIISGVINLIGMVYFYFIIKSFSLPEYWSFFISSLWALSFYILR